MFTKNSNQSNNSLVSNMQKYVENISEIASTSTNYFPSTQREDRSSNPRNTQLLFSNNYCDISQRSSLVNNLNFDQPQQNQKLRPITKKIEIPRNNDKNREISPASNFLSAASPSSEYSSFSPSSFESPQSFRKFYNKQKKQTPKKALPIRSEAVDLSEHIENAKRLKQVTNKTLFCTFCKNNGEKEEVFCSHLLKDSTGKITCPVLKKHVCPICQETGEKAHTITYCKEFKRSKRGQFLQLHKN